MGQSPRQGTHNTAKVPQTRRSVLQHLESDGPGNRFAQHRRSGPAIRTPSILRRTFTPASLRQFPRSSKSAMGNGSGQHRELHSGHRHDCPRGLHEPRPFSDLWSRCETVDPVARGTDDHLLPKSRRTAEYHSERKTLPERHEALLPECPSGTHASTGRHPFRRRGLSLFRFGHGAAETRPQPRRFTAAGDPHEQTAHQTGGRPSVAADTRHVPNVPGPKGTHVTFPPPGRPPASYVFRFRKSLQADFYVDGDDLCANDSGGSPTIRGIPRHA